MAKSRSLNRHHSQRIKNKRKKNLYRFFDTIPQEKEIGKSANCPTNCSCWMCGNPRKFFNEPSLQEISFNQLLKTEI